MYNEPIKHALNDWSLGVQVHHFNKNPAAFPRGQPSTLSGRKASQKKEKKTTVCVNQRCHKRLEGFAYMLQGQMHLDESLKAAGVQKG